MVVRVRSRSCIFLPVSPLPRHPTAPNKLANKPSFCLRLIPFNRYMALAFTIVGTLVDLVPEALMMTELILHPRIWVDCSALRKVLKLMFSDGKPIITFAASQDEVAPVLDTVRTSLRKRCQLYHACRFEKFDDPSPPDHTMFSGIQGSLAAGEILTGVGGGLFLLIEFSWPALISVVWSAFSFLVSTRENMIAVQRFNGDFARFFDEGDSSSYFAIAMPGPGTFLKFVLAVPFWPITLSLWGIFQESPWEDHVWVWPPCWFGVSGFSATRLLDWFLFPHYIFNWILAPFVVFAIAAQVGDFILTLLVLPFAVVLEIVLVGALWRWYFGTRDGQNHCMQWSHDVLARAGRIVFRSRRKHRIITLLELLGSALSTLMAGIGSVADVALVFLVQVGVLVAALFFRGCAEQEWALASVHLGWTLVVLCAKACSRSNPFVTPIQVGYESDNEKSESGEIECATVGDTVATVANTVSTTTRMAWVAWPPPSY